jgi:hypothetical protein
MIAWIKPVVLEDTGITVEFWKLKTVNYDDDAQMSVFNYAGWVNAAAFLAGKAPVIHESHAIPAGLAPELAYGALNFGTAQIRSQAKFEGSITYEP